MHANNIIDNLWVGSWRDAQAALSLIGWGIITTANDAHVKGHVWYPVTDPGTDFKDPNRIASAIETTIEFMYEYSNVLVHCQSGVNRSVTVVIGVLMSKYGMELSEAYDHVFTRRKLIHPQRTLLRMACAATEKTFPDDFELSVLKLDDTDQAVNELYVRVLGRHADPGGLDNYAGAVRSGRITMDGVEAALYRSDEYKKKFGFKNNGDK